MVQTVLEHCVRLKLRLEKEKRRGPLPVAEGGDTTAIGGWGKIGIALELLLRALFEELAAEAKLKLSDALRDYAVAGKPTIGKWNDAVTDIGAIAIGTGRVSPTARLLLDDLGKDKFSSLYRLGDIRNRLQHAAPNRPTPAEAEKALDSALALLARVTPATS